MPVVFADTAPICEHLVDVWRVNLDTVFEGGPEWTTLPASRRRDCPFTGIPSPSILKHLLEGEGSAAESHSLADDYSALDLPTPLL